MSKWIIQNLRRRYLSSYETASVYYSILSVLNDLKLSNREIQLLGFTAVKGTISYKAHKQEFCKLHQSSIATINNMIYQLRNKGLLVKIQGKYKVNPVIDLNFSGNIALYLKIQTDEKPNHAVKEEKTQPEGVAH